MQQQLSALQERMARAEKNSSNSSKPPSSDIVKPPKPAARKGKKHRRGGQWGHTKYERTFHLEDADVIHAHYLDCCPSCASPHLFHFAGAEQTHYQYELVDYPILLHAHQSHLYNCAEYAQIHAGSFSRYGASGWLSRSPSDRFDRPAQRGRASILHDAASAPRGRFGSPPFDRDVGQSRR